MQTVMMIAKWSCLAIPAACLVACYVESRRQDKPVLRFGDFPSPPENLPQAYPRTGMASLLTKALARTTAGLLVAIIVTEAGTSLFPWVL